MGEGAALLVYTKSAYAHHLEEGLLFFLDICIYLRKRACVYEEEGQRMRERERFSSRLAAEHLALLGARSHDPEITTLRS